MCSHAQIFNLPLPIDNSFSVITEKNKSGIFKAQKVKGKITGSGIYKYKTGTIYIGDFKDKTLQGHGILIASQTDSITNCPNARYYVGRFKNGLKNGKGVCYDINGNVIYSGKFVEDQPVDHFQEFSSEIKYFADIKTDDFYYIGELEGNFPNGSGAVFFPNGDFLISNFLDGDRTGNSIYIQADGNWISENVDGNQVTPISSSAEYSDLVSKSKAAFRAGLGQAFGYLAQAAEMGTQIAYQAKNLNSSTASNNTYNNNASSFGNSDSITKTGNGSSESSGYDMSEQRNYNSDKSTYNKYDSMLSQVFSGNRDASASEIKNWQSKMKSIRQKWENKGRNFPHSSNEDR